MTAENGAVEPPLDFEACDSGVGVFGLSESMSERRLVDEGSMDGALLADCV